MNHCQSQNCRMFAAGSSALIPAGLKILPCLRDAACTQRERLETSLIDRWTEFIVWKRDATGGDDDPHDGPAGSKLELEFVGGKEGCEQFAAVIQAMANLSVLGTHVRGFGSQLMKYVITPIITRPDALVVVCVVELLVTVGS